MKPLTRRRIVGILAGILTVAVLGTSAFLLSSRGIEWPERIWVRDPGMPAQVVRVGSPSGAIAEVEWDSVMSSKEGAVVGISFRPPHTPLWRLVVLLPRYREYSPGYEATERTEGLQGEVWHEFVKFEPRFTMRQFGWWRW